MAGGKGGRVTISMALARVDKVTREFNKFADRTSRNFAKISKQMAIMNRSGAKTVRTTDKMSKSLSRLANLGSLVIAYRAVQRLTQIIGDFATAVLNVMSHLADFENRVKVAFGVFTDVGAHMEYVSKLSNRLGVNIRASRESFAKLSVAASLSGLKIGEIKEIYESVAEAARVYNLSADRTRLSFLAIEQMINKGKVSYEELRRQLGEQIPGAFQLAAKAMGVTTKELDQMLVKGELYTDEFLPKFARALRESVGDQLEEATTRGISNIARLTNATQKWMETFSNRELEEDVGDFSKETSRLIENMDGLALSLQKVLSLLVKVGEVGVSAVAAINTEIVGKKASVQLSEWKDQERELSKEFEERRRNLVDHRENMAYPPLPQNMKGKRRRRLDSLEWWTGEDKDEKIARITKKYKDQGEEEFAPYALYGNVRTEERELDAHRAGLQEVGKELEKVKVNIRKLYGANYELVPGFTGESAEHKMIPNMRDDIRQNQYKMSEEGLKERDKLFNFWEDRRVKQLHRGWAREQKIFDERVQVQLGYEEAEKTQRATHLTAMYRAQEDFHKRELDERKKQMESWGEISESVTGALKGLANNSLTAAAALNRVAEALLEKFAYKPFENFLTDNLSSLFGAASGAGGGGGLSGVAAVLADWKGAGQNPGIGGGSGFNITNNFGANIDTATQNSLLNNQIRQFGGG